LNKLQTGGNSVAFQLTKLDLSRFSAGPCARLGSVAKFLGLFLRWKYNTGFHWNDAKETGGTMVDFKGAHYPKDVIVHAVFFYVRYAVSYRDLEEILAGRGIEVDHATLNRWVVKYSPLIAANAQAKKRPTGSSWRMDETYIKVKGKGAVAKFFLEELCSSHTYFQVSGMPNYPKFRPHKRKLSET
jgi:hypothetical protein